MLPIFLLSDAGARMQAKTFSELFQQLSTLCSLFVSNTTSSGTNRHSRDDDEHCNSTPPQQTGHAGHCATFPSPTKRGGEAERRRGGVAECGRTYKSAESRLRRHLLRLRCTPHWRACLNLLTTVVRLL